MKNTNTPASKYRPVLTAAQIEHILTLAKLESPISATSFSVIATLSPFLAKIQNNAVTAAYSTTEKSSKFSVSGLGGTSLAQPDNTTYDSNVSKEAYWEQCYTKYEIAGPANCTLEELDAVAEYRYLHDLMTPEEQANFEMGTPDGAPK
tara:strand:- start:13720 stop:14166 length:447 start_codon:yes stop_codon:yes gene_type:complete